MAIPILSLIGLYAYAATTTASNAINLSRSRTLKDTIGTPTGNFEAQIDAERLLAVAYLAAPVPSNLATLRAQEAKTQAAEEAFKNVCGQQQRATPRGKTSRPSPACWALPPAFSRRCVPRSPR